MSKHNRAIEHSGLESAKLDKSDGLVRVMGRWTLTALVINSIVGNGIFGVPSIVSSYLGQWSPLAYLIAAVGMGIIMACFAEVASQFRKSGGPYLYAREAFGRFLGIETGWLLWLIRVTASAAAVNLFTNYLAEFWPNVNQPLPRLAVLSILVGFLTIVNYCGVESGAAASNIFTIAKLSALLSFAIAGGIFLLRTHPAIPPPSPGSSPLSVHNWFEAMLVLVFAFGGFEAAVVPMAEAKDPGRDTPFALFTALLTTAILFCAIQFVVVRLLPSASVTNRPLADAAREMGGGVGATLITLGALISLYGYLSAQMLHTPRLTFALAESGDLPAIFSNIHSRFRTPHVSILFFSAIVWGMAAVGNFKANVIISSVGRLFVYGVVCAALPVLRRIHPGALAYRVPMGNLLATAGVIFMLVLISRMRRGEWIVILVTMAIAFANWQWARKRNA
ncbi:MAG TPA: APC family permease [Candidatus Acidoferrales bacterium]|nr:APC family permease [Candidatus Acidoferrales bacterium]